MTTEIVSSAVPQVLPGQRSAARADHDAAATSPRAAQRTAGARATAIGRARLAPAAVLASLDLVVLGAATSFFGVPPAQAVLLAVLTVCLFALPGLYRSRLAPSALDDLPQLAGRVLVAGAVVVAVEVVTGAAEPPVAVLQASAAVAVLVGLERVVAYTAIARLRRTGVLAKPTLVVGGGAVAASLSDVLLAHPEYGLQPVGLVDDEPLPGTEDPPVPRLSGPQGLQALVAEHGARAVIVAYGSAPESSVVDALRACDRLSCEVYVVPRLFELRGPGGDVESVWGIPLVRLRRSTFRTLGWRAKRVVDVVLAATAAVLLAPVLGACALLVRLETGPKVLFRQQRIGMDGRPFDVLKFRSLRPASDRESAQLWSVAADDRIGPIGRILRRTSLDELPQLWNILRGDMSLVGPRPERPHFVAEFASQFPRYDDRHRVPVGLTGWSQVNGLRGDTSIADRTRFDNDYIENWSLWLDVKILLRTVGQVLRGAGR
jgi:exopolysaccharide biosynthesis polyprenyl glycosylphosphotransferase